MLPSMYSCMGRILKALLKFTFSKLEQPVGWMLLGRVSPGYTWCSVDSSVPLSIVMPGMNRVSCFHMCEWYTILLYLSSPFQQLIFSLLVTVDWTGEPSLKECDNFTPVSKLVDYMLRTTLSLALAVRTVNYVLIVFNISETSFPPNFWVCFFIVDSGCWIEGSWGYLIPF